MFDPLLFSDVPPPYPSNPVTRYVDIKRNSRYREAELKHGRLAMVALAGWPVATLFLGLLTKVGVGLKTTAARG